MVYTEVSNWDRKDLKIIMNNFERTEKEQIIMSLLGLLLNYNQCFNNFLDIRQYHLTKTQLMIIVALSRYPGITMSELSEKISASREQTSRAVSPLVQRQLISRDTNQLNRRQINMALTDDGFRYLSHIKENYLDMFFSAFDRLSEEERKTFLASLKNISDTLSRMVSP